LKLFRGALNTTEIPAPMVIDSLGDYITCMEFASNGDVLYLGFREGAVMRVSGLKGLYRQDDVEDLSLTVIYNDTNANVSGMAMDPARDSRLVVTLIDTLGKGKVVLIDNALDDQPTVTDVTGNLDDMPVYDAEIDVNDQGIVLVGTLRGVWATSDIDANDVYWVKQGGYEMDVPVMDIRQQRLPWKDATNTGMYYFATYGRGLWESASLTGIEEPESQERPVAPSLAVYPNPARDYMNVYLEDGRGAGQLLVLDLTGRVVQSQRIVASGPWNGQVNTGLLPAGPYTLVYKTDNSTKTARFIRMP